MADEEPVHTSLALASAHAGAYVRAGILVMGRPAIDIDRLPGDKVTVR
jgi:hypothetical protein